jgi:hypothetical protein
LCPNTSTVCLQKVCDVAKRAISNS